MTQHNRMQNNVIYYFIFSTSGVELDLGTEFKNTEDVICQ